MKSTFKVALRANERLYINGAVITCDRKTCIEFLNDVNFLLENHVMQAAQATTPLRQLYFVIQVMLMSPYETSSAMGLYRVQLPATLDAFSHQGVLAQVKDADRLVHEERYYEAMKALRSVFKLEDEIMLNTDRETAAVAA
jgi:flagellar biosynthesis repressor protein FlbT